MFFDCRTNVHKTLKQKRLSFGDFKEFIELCCAGDRGKRRETWKEEPHPNPLPGEEGLDGGGHLITRSSSPATRPTSTSSGSRTTPWKILQIFSLEAGDVKQFQSSDVPIEKVTSESHGSSP